MGLGPLLEVIRALPEALDILYEAGDRAGDRWATDRGDRIGAREPGQTEHRRQEPDLKPEAAELESVTRS
jgi:hypothetical protein